jgi:hypothetical protein
MIGGKANYIANGHYDAQNKLNNIIKTTTCICKGDDNKYTVGCVVAQENGTQMVQVHDIGHFMEVLFNKDLKPEDYKEIVKECSFLACRTKGKNYVETCMGFYNDEQLKAVRAEKDAVIRAYTAQHPIVYPLININLAFDASKEVQDRILPGQTIGSSEFIKKLKCCIGSQYPKHKGICWRGTSLNPVELLMMFLKVCFYIPSFVSTSLDRKVALKPPFKGNVLFEIDTSEFNEFSTIIQSYQTNYPEEKECLISCYNIYKWMGFKVESYAVVVKLKLVKYHITNDADTNSIKDAKHGDIPEKIFKSGHQDLSNKNLPPQKLFDTVNKLIEIVKK